MGFRSLGEGDGSQILDNRIQNHRGDLAGLGNDAVGASSKKATTW